MLIDFDAETMENLSIGDKIQIKAFGCGLKLIDYPEIKVLNLDPDPIEKLKLKRLSNGRLEVPVTHRVPAKIMGSGIGSTHSNTGDYDIQLFDAPTVKRFGLNDLKLGDFVAITDAEATYGRIYRTGGVVIGIIVHSDCVLAGHGPGVMVVMSSKEGLIVPKISKRANLNVLFS